MAFANNICMFVCKHDKYFLYCNRNSIRYGGEYSAFEGTNFGLKDTNISTHPRLSIDNSMVILRFQSDKPIINLNDNQR